MHTQCESSDLTSHRAPKARPKRRSTVRLLTAAGACAIVLGPAAITATLAAEPDGGQRPAAFYDAGVPSAWARLLYQRIANQKFPPVIAARIIGYTQVALYESLAPGMKRHQDLAGQLNGLGPVPAGIVRGGLHWPTVANAACAAMLRGLITAPTPDTTAAIDALEAHFATAATVPPTVRDRSIQRGRDVAAHILAWASGDGIAQFNNCPYTPPVGDGFWVPTPPAFAPALQPCWGDLRPLALPTAGSCDVAGPPAFSTDPASTFYAQGKEVHDTVLSLTQEQRDIAIFWADNPGQTGTPPGHSLSIATQLIEAGHLSLEDAAEAYARVGIAVADGFISCWRTKFIWNLVRPVTYIQRTIDAAWLPLLPTPAFPEYTSGHSVQSSAAARILATQFGDAPFTDHTHDLDLGLAPRSFDSLSAAAQEAAISRLYGGIHYRAAIETGLEQGACVARTIEDRVSFTHANEAPGN